VPEAFVGGREGDEPVGHRAVRDEMLGAAEYEAVAVAAVRGRERGDVGAGGRLGNREGAEREFLGKPAEIVRCWAGLRRSTRAAAETHWR